MSALLTPDFWLGAMTLAGVYGVLTLGVQLNIGFSGVVNLGQTASMGVGAYTMAILVVRADWSMWAAIPVGLILGIILSVLLGLTSNRLPDDYFAIVTLAAASLIVVIAQNLVGLTGGTDGMSGFTDEWAEIQLTVGTWLEPVGLGDQFAAPLAVVTWVIFFLLAFALHWLQRQPWGRVLRAIREDEDAAAALGKNVFLYKLQSMGIAGGLAALAGVLMALNLSVVYPNSFNLDVIFFATAIMLLCGLGSYLGLAYGAVVLWIILEGARFADLPLTGDRVAALRMLIVGLILVLAGMLRPQGLFGNKEEMVLRDD